MRSFRRATVVVLATIVLAGAADDPYRVAILCTSFPVTIGRRVAVSNGDELQHALDTASAGDTIVLTPGATFHPTPALQSFILRNRPVPSGQWVVIRSLNVAFDV